MLRCGFAPHITGYPLAKGGKVSPVLHSVYGWLPGLPIQCWHDQPPLPCREHISAKEILSSLHVYSATQHTGTPGMTSTPSRW